MKSTIFAALAAALLAAVPPARAGEHKPPLFFCTPAAQIAAKLEDCEDNDAFIDQGEDCLDKLDAESKKETEAMKARLSPDAVAKQEAKFESSLEDYRQSSASLAYLIALDELAIQEMDQYLASLEDPEDADEPDVNGGDPQAYRMSVTCYGETTRSLRGIQGDFRDRLRKLQAAKKAADDNAAMSARRRTNVDAATAGGAKAAGGKGQGSGVPHGKSPKAGSDITGVEQDLKKQGK